jgi:hypothetical protein
MSSIPRFEKKVLAEVWNPAGPGEMNTMLAVGDLNNDGFPDLIVSGRNGHLVWLQNPGLATPSENWQRHLVNTVTNIECGGAAVPVQGKTGWADIVAGSSGGADTLQWFANPGKVQLPSQRWPRTVIAQTGFRQFHDVVAGTVHPGEPLSLFFTNQGGEGGGRLWRVPIPSDPSVSPWPGLELIADNLWEPNPYHPQWVPSGKQPAEGLAVGDLDGDGINELVCGCHWFKQRADGGWDAHRFANGYVTTKCLIADVDGDGCNEIVLSEGDAVIYGFPRGCRCAWFKPGVDGPHGLWTEHLILDGMLDAHTLKAGAITRPGAVDLVVGEIGKGNWDLGSYDGQPPRLWVLQNDGKGNFTPHLIDEGHGVHDAALVDLRNNGRLDIIGKPLHGPHKWKIVAWFNQGVMS